MYTHFELVLMITHNCNLDCSYCYAGAKSPRSMTEEIGRKAIDRALASLSPAGTLDLGFFGGEPLAESGLVYVFIEYARQRCADKGMHLQIGITTNGTWRDPNAWKILTLPDLELAVSHDGLPELHDRHRVFSNRRGSSETVLQTIQMLLDAGKELQVVMVVRPDNVEKLPEGIAFLRNLGVRYVQPTLDLWTRWSPEDGLHLEHALARCVRLWRDGLPDHGISCFDEKAALIAKIPITKSAHCSFGNGQIAVAPSGRLYPCERVIGEDRESNPMMLPGHALEGENFLTRFSFPCRCTDACSACSVQNFCDTTCRCSNYVRTGDVKRPDRLLCMFNQICLRETAQIMQELVYKPSKSVK